MKAKSDEAEAEGRKLKAALERSKAEAKAALERSRAEAKAILERSRAEAKAVLERSRGEAKAALDRSRDEATKYILKSNKLERQLERMVAKNEELWCRLATLEVTLFEMKGQRVSSSGGRTHVDLTADDTSPAAAAPRAPGPAPIRVRVRRPSMSAHAPHAGATHAYRSVPLRSASPSYSQVDPDDSVVEYDPVDPARYSTDSPTHCPHAEEDEEEEEEEEEEKKTGPPRSDWVEADRNYIVCMYRDLSNGTDPLDGINVPAVIDRPAVKDENVCVTCSTDRAFVKLNCSCLVPAYCGGCFRESLLKLPIEIVTVCPCCRTDYVIGPSPPSSA
jgi:hypothetical protein